MSQRRFEPDDVDAILTRERLADARLSFSRASTLPAEAFTSPAIYEREIEQIFSHEWLCTGRADQIPNTGDYFTIDLLGDKLVIVRGTDGAIRALSRVCRHRAAEVVRGSGTAKSFQCPYHAWTYRLDGSLLGAPYMDEVEDFDRKKCRLPEIRSEMWEGWIFINFDSDALSLESQLAPLSKLLASYKMSDMIGIETATFDSPFNWKVLVDNFMEAYHHIATHNDTLEPLFPAALSGTPDNQGPYSVLVMPPARAEQAPAENPTLGLPPAGTLDADEATGLIAAVVFPFHLFAPTADSLTWYQLLPERVDRFTLRIFSCFSKQMLADPAHRDSIEALQGFTKTIHLQDIEACEAAWAGLASRSFESGRLSPLERSIWQFNQWWIDRMTRTD